MVKPFIMFASVLTFVTNAAASAAIDLTTLDRHMSGPRAQVLVLGTIHLSEQKNFRPTTLDHVIERLTAFKPEIITIEAISGEQCDLVARHPSVYDAGACDDTNAAKAATGLDVPSAIAEVAKVFKNWPATITPANRRHLAALFLAANDRSSAYVQWLQLPDAERHAGDGLDDALVAMMRKVDETNNEDYRIAARVAATLGLQRVYAVDDHTGDDMPIPDEKAFGEALTRAWDSMPLAKAETAAQEAKLSQGADWLPLYRYINSPNYLATAAKLNVQTSMESTSPERYPQMWVAGWETRNLRMIANVRATFRDRPAARVLAIVGATHKPWFDAWLGQLQGIHIVDAQTVLR